LKRTGRDIPGKEGAVEDEMMMKEERDEVKCVYESGSGTT